ncbi:cysteine--tRNA ligase [Candidatus Woesearchaeota archaeon]|nr:cysteine--tRNA ligase [Candidatus Woesearchaeota archaeon]
MSLCFHNTLTGKKELFEPLRSHQVRMYNCGPTVYDYAHIGNFRAYICSDILKRYLIYKGFKVKQVMNITDVDDKTIRASQKAGLTLQAYTDKYTQAFFEDLETLRISKPDIFPRATAYIDDMVALIKDLLNKGLAYKAPDGIYYAISKFKSYGKLSKIDLHQTKAGVRVQQDEYDKHQAQDFALWKFWTEKDGDVFWETALGKGRPGWHIECSAMSMKNLGQTFDIHTGGIDLIFPHHENEIAQSEAATGRTFVNYWLHNEYIKVDGKKMSKSLGNFYTLRDLLAKGYSSRAIRYLLLSTQYRQPLNFTLQGVAASQQAVARIDEFMEKQEKVSGKDNQTIKQIIADTKKRFETALDDDLNISEGLAALFDFMKEINTLMSNNLFSHKDAEAIKECMHQFDLVLGIMHKQPESVPEEIVVLADQREEARKVKDFKKADQLRALLEKKGYLIEDLKNTYLLKKM